MEPFALNGKLILADKGYDSDKFVRWLEERGGIAVIPSRITAKHPRKTDWHTYKERHLVENLFLKLKNSRRFATRYEKRMVFEREQLRKFEIDNLFLFSSGRVTGLGRRLRRRRGSRGGLFLYRGGLSALALGHFGTVDKVPEI